MNGQMSDQNAQQQAQASTGLGGLGQAALAKNPGLFGEVIQRLEKQNAELNELILGQRDASVKLTGDNPVVETEGTDAPTAQGDLAALNAAVVRHNELISKIRGLTEHWQSL